MPPIEIDKRSRSAFSPALPTAMTMRPQLGSPAESAVLTSGELPIASPIRRAARAVAAPVTSIVTNFCAPLPVTCDLWGKCDKHRIERAAKTREPPIGRTQYRAVWCLLRGAEE